MKRMSRPACLARAIFTTLGLVISVANVRAAGEGVQPLSPDEKVFGLTYGEWVAAWEQWLFSIPVSVNPANDTSGIRAAIGQRLPVWFLAPGPPGAASSKRTIVVPAGSVLLVPGPAALVLYRPGERTEQQIRDQLRDNSSKFLDAISVLETTVDGVPVLDVKRYRVQTPLFTAVLPTDNLLGFPISEGKDQRVAMIAEGYFLLLPPLPAGNHVLQARVEGTDPNNSSHVKIETIYNIVVRSPNEPLQ